MSTDRKLQIASALVYFLIILTDRGSPPILVYRGTGSPRHWDTGTLKHKTTLWHEHISKELNILWMPKQSLKHISNQCYLYPYFCVFVFVNQLHLLNMYDKKYISWCTELVAISWVHHSLPAQDPAHARYHDLDLWLGLIE